MAQLTFLEIVNKVLVKLREDTVGTVNANDYSSLIAAFVNDAKKEVENAWNWQILLENVNFSTQVGDNDVDLSESSADLLTAGFTTLESRLAYDECGRPMAFDVTANEPCRLIEYNRTRILGDRLLQDPKPTNETPLVFTLVPNSNNGLTISFLDNPLESRDYVMFFYTPQEELENDNDVLTIPWRPVVNLAHLYALDERGEEIGEPGSKAWLRYERSLGDAIALDSKNPDAYKITFDV